MKRSTKLSAAAAVLLLASACHAEAEVDQVGFGQMESNLVFTSANEFPREVVNVTFLAASETSQIWDTANVLSTVDGETHSFPVNDISKGDTTPEGILGTMNIDVRGFSGELTSLAFEGDDSPHDIGRISIQTGPDSKGSLEVTDEYAAVYPVTETFFAAVENTSNTPVDITGVNLGLKGISTDGLQVCGQALPAGQTVTMAPRQVCEVDMRVAADPAGEFQYFQSNPRITYTVAGETQAAVLPLIQYRVGSISETDLKAMASRQKNL